MYLIPVLLFVVCLIHGLCRAYYDVGFEVADNQKVKYSIFMLPNGWSDFKFVHEPLTPKWVQKDINEDIKFQVDSMNAILVNDAGFVHCEDCSEMIETGDKL